MVVALLGGIFLVLIANLWYYENRLQKPQKTDIDILKVFVERRMNRKYK